MRTIAGARIWYQSFTDPDADRAYFGRLHEQSFAIGGATVLNGLPVAIVAAESAIRLGRLNGTGTSRRTAFALPTGEAVAEFRNAFRADPPRAESVPSR